jgi:hypothetical protein
LFEVTTGKDTEEAEEEADGMLCDATAAAEEEEDVKGALWSKEA